MTSENETGGSARTIKASEFKARCLALMDEIAESGEEIVITKRGKPVAKLAPCEDRPVSWFGRDRDMIRMHDDLIEPVDVFRSSEPRSDLKANLDGLWLAVSLLEDRLRESGE